MSLKSKLDQSIVYFLKLLLLNITLGQRTVPHLKVKIDIWCSPEKWLEVQIGCEEREKNPKLTVVTLTNADQVVTSLRYFVSKLSTSTPLN